MDAINIKLDNLLIEINKSINEKISGTKFLELLKSGLIEKFKDLEENDLNKPKLMPLEGKILEKDIDLNNRKITYRIEYFDKSISKIKNNIENDYLCIVLEGLKSITIYDNNNHKKSIYSNLLKNMGIVLSQNTVITSKIAEKSIILLISNN